MDRKERTLKAIRLKEIDRIPTTYRGMKYVTKALMKYLGIGDTEDFGKIKSDFLEKLDSNYWGMGHNICYFSAFHAKYNGPIPDSPYIQNDFFSMYLGPELLQKKVEKL